MLDDTEAALPPKAIVPDALRRKAAVHETARTRWARPRRGGTPGQEYLADLTKRVSKALRAMREAGEVRSVADAKGNLSWERR